MWIINLNYGNSLISLISPISFCFKFCLVTGVSVFDAVVVGVCVGNVGTWGKSDGKKYINVEFIIFPICKTM